ncbi:hypothetical protein [Sphingomicrobium aestuariivivum]|uniref:hypothetical protein n=1 Tax=Sphingomicrobium aestuariivivum TaxID=1582356 RepID=UPI001FD683E4|nr:hypothetical protein [Sphingomicrobium aestuariivivum]MCJ8191972.1 hypothetical protein [Sphingomicrobium aestuariivivum]
MLTAALLLIAPVPSAGTVFDCTPTAVWDGDGPIWCEEGPRIRLSGIAAREIDDECRAGHPCPAASGAAARDALVNLLGGPRGSLSHGHVVVRAPTMRCVSTGSAGGSRTGAWCVTASGVDLSCAMVASGNAERWARYWGRHQCK